MFRGFSGYDVVARWVLCLLLGLLGLLVTWNWGFDLLCWVLDDVYASTVSLAWVWCYNTTFWWVEGFGCRGVWLFLGFDFCCLRWTEVLIWGFVRL